MVVEEREYDSHLGGAFEIAFGWCLETLKTLIAYLVTMGALSLGFESTK